jgi:hypothetical protein
VPRIRSCVVLLIAALAALSAVQANAQSGRRPPPRRPEPAPAPAETAPPPPSARPEYTGPKVPIAAAKYVTSINIPDAVASYVLEACLARFREVPSFEVTPGKDMNRKEATDLAKRNDQTYVLLLQFSIDAADEDRAGMGPSDLRNLVVAYTLYTPGTAKTKTQGRLYFSADYARAGNGRVLVPYSGVGRGPRGYTPDEAGRKVADYVMDSLGSAAAGPLPPIH